MRVRQPQRAVRLALILWFVLAFVVWNVVFDYVVVETGREYIRAARQAADQGSFARVGDWMQPGAARAFRAASAAGAAILTAGIVLVRLAADRDRRSTDEEAFAPPADA
jgi:hypothetical protein